MEAGTNLKHYRIVARLGEGGMGVVYRAEDTRLGRTVALKVFPADLAADPERVSRFEREARAASAVSHPGIATLYDFDREGDTAFLTMEFVEGRTLRELLKGGSLPLPRLLECLTQVSDAMAAAHSKGIVHRDLKPENVMASDSGFYKILDFGLARMEVREDADASEQTSPTQMATVSRELTGEGKIIGTIAYMSPEQAQGQPLDPRSDIFSFGTLLYELATGTSPFKGNNAISTFHAIVHDDPAPLSSVVPGIPPELERITTKCLAKDPRERYQTAADLVVDLRALRRDSDSGSRSLPTARAYAPPVHARRRPPIAWMLAGAGVVIIAVALVLIGRWPWGRSDSPERPVTAIAPGRDVSLPPADVPSDASAPTTQRNRVVVPFFHNRSGDAGADWLEQGLPEMLTTDLVNSEGLEVISTQKLYDLLAAAGGSPAGDLDQRTAAELARWVGAGVVVGGSIYKVGEGYRIDVQAYDTTTGQVITAGRAEGSDVFAMVDQLAADLRRGLQVSTPKGEGIERVTTSSPEAYRFYSAAMKDYQGLRFSDASRELRRSLEEDPDFALAQLRLGMSLSLAGVPEEGTTWIGRAAAHAERMPERERRLAAAINAYYGSEDPEAAEKSFEDLMELYPQDVEVHVWRAHAQASRSGDRLGAIRTLKRAHVLDPNDPLAVSALVGHLRELELQREADAILADFLARNPAAAGAPIGEVPFRRPPPP